VRLRDLRLHPSRELVDEAVDLLLDVHAVAVIAPEGLLPAVLDRAQPR
jgi:hypothetical protein